MSDVVVTVPMNFTHPCSTRRGLRAWIDEGDAAGTDWTGKLWVFSTFGPRPDIAPSERVYIVCEGRLRGYAPLIRMRYGGGLNSLGRVEFIRGGGAVAVTIPGRIPGFRGWRYRWWDRDEEIPFFEWMEVTKL